MTEKIIVVDDLYDIPHQYHKGFFENQCLIGDELIQKVSEIVGNPIQVVEASNEILVEGQNTTVCSHLSADWIAVIYLTLPLTTFGESGIKFYSHLATGLETFPTREDLQRYGISEDQLLEVLSYLLKDLK